MQHCSRPSSSPNRGGKVSGTVYDSSDEIVAFANVFVKGATGNGTTTDLDGHFSLTANVGSTLFISFIGYEDVEYVVNGPADNVVIKFAEGVNTLDELVVVGYGVQKKKLVTGSSLQIKGDEIAARNTVSPVGALQGQTPGVNIMSNGGKPNSGYKINIRGVGTNGNTDPIVVIDGLVGGMDNLNALNPNDIESLDVLKDAASTAIYGARAANGVILVTTKHGKEGKANITLDSYVGWQNIASRPQMLNAEQYMYIYDAARMYEGNAVNDWASIVPAGIWEKLQNGWQGTDWLDLMIGDNAPQQSYNIGVTGGSRNIVKFGQNLILAYNNSNGLDAVSTGGAWSNTVRQGLKASPLFPCSDDEGEWIPGAGWLKDSQGNPVRSATRGGADQNNSKSYSARGNFFVQIESIENLVFRSTFGFGYSGYTSRSYSIPYDDGTFGSVTVDRINQSSGNDFSWSWENTLSYTFSIQKNNFTALLGTSAEKWGYGEGLSAGRTKNSFGDWKHAYINNGTSLATDAGAWSMSGWPSGQGAINSYFGRINWDYDGKYMATVILRADGSSNFARGHRWGYFPSVSAGWNIDRESFMEGTKGFLDQLKLRASWGQNGNCNIANFQYLATIAVGGADYFFGDDKVNKIIGSYPNKIANPDVSWETSEQLDFGVDARFFKSRLDFTFDWYRKTTKDWLVNAPILASYGTGAPYINGGDVRNQGVELGINWRDGIGDFTYSIGTNLAYNSNKVTRLANDSGVMNGPGDAVMQNTGYISRIQVGQPIGFFYGYKTLGVFQNRQQIDEYVDANGNKIQPTAIPGDLIFYDRDGDGQISDNDKMMIGDPHPDVTFGLNISLAYKGFDLSVNGYGAFGQQIAGNYRDHTSSGYDNWTYNLASQVWHGEGTGNRYPRPSTASHINWQYISDIYVDDADYFRIQNLMLGYDFKKTFKAIPLERCRVYVSFNNLATFTKYKGFDPEIGTDGN